MFRFIVYGHPAPGGSKIARMNRKTGKPYVAPASESTQHWRACVTTEIAKQRMAMGLAPFEHKVVLRMVFSFRRPKSVPRSKRPYMTVAPDVSKLARSTEDALTDAGFWSDDSLVGYDRLDKVYCDEDPESLSTEGVLIVARYEVALAMSNTGRAPLELEAA